MSEFELTETELAAGVTYPDAAELSYRGYVTIAGLVVVESKSPALSGAAARMLAGGPVDFLHFNPAGHAVYEPRRA